MKNLIKVINIIKDANIQNMTVCVDAWGLPDEEIEKLTSLNPDNTRLGGRGDSIMKKIRITKDTTKLERGQIITFLERIADCYNVIKKVGVQVEYVLLTKENEYSTERGKVDTDQIFYALENSILGGE